MTSIKTTHTKTTRTAQETPDMKTTMTPKRKTHSHETTELPTHEEMTMKSTTTPHTAHEKTTMTTKPKTKTPETITHTTNEETTMKATSTDATRPSHATNQETIMPTKTAAATTMPPPGSWDGEWSAGDRGALKGTKGPGEMGACVQRGTLAREERGERRSGDTFMRHD
jgi:uncharacterized membrane protein